MKNKNKCAGYWFINSQNVGECIKLYPDKDLIPVCGETGKPCPYDGVKDFGKLQHRSERVREWMRISKGGKRSHG